VVPEGESTTTLVYAVREADEDHGPVWLTLLTYDEERNRAAAIYIPAHLASEIPGRGLLSLSDGWVSGGPSLLLASAENLLGMKIDRYMELSDNDAEILFEGTGPLSINVPSEVQVAEGTSGARVIFDVGPQELSTEFLVRLLYTRGLDVDDAELGSRILAFWDALLERYAGDRTGLNEVITATGPALESDATIEDLAEFFESLASVPESDVLLASLPVRPIAAGDSELYSADIEETSRLLTEAMGEGVSTEDDVRVQVLNGNGVPGIGAEVADRLIGEGFRVILSGNARRFDYETTVIVTYDDSEEGMALAERARELLGVGEVQVSSQHQGSVDLTIVIGKDFLRAP
jgi:anionic cell wall polymer biosynthesis LytR-Cps2A-Psr (LCP) family protein